MVDDDLIDGDGETGDGAEPAPVGALETPGVDGACLSCGAATVGVFCPNCGQKNDDLRRSLFSLARDFVEDTFAFDSRMWRTLGFLAFAPGVVPTNYAHGRRSKYTPPVRLFLVVSFLFFLLLSVTQTLFVAVEISDPGDPPDNSAIASVTLDEDDLRDPATEEDGSEAPSAADRISEECRISVNLRYFVRVGDLNSHDQERWAACAGEIQSAIDGELQSAQSDDGESLSDEDREHALGFVETTFAGVNRAISDPKAFNAAFNNWLPRVMFLMTPVLALIMGIFIRGKDALFFDHMVLSIYSHAVGFATVGLALVVAQAGAPFAGLAAAAGLALYFIMTVKRAYNRGWIKTVYSSVTAGFLYILILTIVVIAIVSRIIMA